MKKFSIIKISVTSLIAIGIVGLAIFAAHKYFGNGEYLFSDNKAEKQDVLSKKIKFETSFDGETELSFKYIQRNINDVAFIDQSESNYHVTNIIGSEYDLLEYNNSIYLINIKSGVVEQVLHEDDEYNKGFIDEHITEMDVNYYQLTWGANPHPNISGDKFTYYSTRNALKGGSSTGEIRLKNLDTGDDYSLGDIGHECLGWDANDNVYYYTYSGDIISVDIDSRKAEIVLTGAGPRSILAYPYIIYLTGMSDGFAVYNIAEKTTELINQSSLTAISGLICDPSGTAVLFQNDFYRPDADYTKAPDSNLGILNITDKTIRFLNLPDSFTLQRYSWVSDETISLILLSTDTYEEKTYLIDISYFIDPE